MPICYVKCIFINKQVNIYSLAKVQLLTPSHPHWPTDRALVFQKVEALTAIECKLLVTLKEREVLGDGVGNENVVAGVVVVLSLVEREMGVSELGSL